MQKSARLKKIARHLLATTCLTVAAVGVAGASTFTEGSDFSNTFAGANALPIGTDVVNGSLFGSLAPDNDDYFRFSGLLAGSSFSLNASTPDSGWLGNLLVFSSSQSQIGTTQALHNSAPANASGIVPLDGILVVDVAFSEGTGPDAYTVSLTAPLDQTAQTPEPSTLAGVGLGLAGALALRRRQKA